jgi:hypothetical protein
LHPEFRTARLIGDWWALAVQSFFAKATQDTQLVYKTSLPAWELGIVSQVLDGCFPVPPPSDCGLLFLATPQLGIDLSPVAGDDAGDLGDVFGGGAEVDDARAQQVAAVDHCVGHENFAADF